MSAREIVAAVFLGAGTLLQLLCCVGVWLAPNAYSRLHFVSPATSLAAFFIAVAMVVHDGFNQAGSKALLLFLLLLFSGAFLSHATARAARTRALQGWEPPVMEQER